jgi:hypothetical protein
MCGFLYVERLTEPLKNYDRDHGGHNSSARKSHGESNVLGRDRLNHELRYNRPGHTHVRDTLQSAGIL